MEGDIIQIEGRDGGGICTNSRGSKGRDDRTRKIDTVEDGGVKERVKRKGGKME